VTQALPEHRSAPSRRPPTSYRAVVPTRPDRGDLLVAGQMVCTGAAAFWPGSAKWAVPTVVRVLAFAAIAGGSVLGFQGAVKLGGELRSHPRPPAGAVLRTDGVYARVRHPIYTGILLGAGGAAVLRGRPEPLAAVAVLTAILNVKARYEERLLRDHFGVDYDAYAARVPRFIPRIGLAQGTRVP
jgi:protein-S-isoprenylcysteine O-methyltransferase Ste14